KWHDGAPFSADDVVFTFNTLLDPKTNTVRRSSYIIDGVPIQFKKMGTHIFQATLPKPFAPVLVRLSIPILPKHILEKENINQASFNRKPVGTGPFKFEEWKSGQYIRLSRNDQYFGKKPLLKGIILKMIPDTNTALVALEKGEIDTSGIPPKDYERYQSKNNLDIYRFSQLNYTYMGFNLKSPLFSDHKVRIAISHAINRDTLVKNVLKGFGRPAYLPTSPVMWSYPNESKIEKYGYNPEKSIQILQEIGYKKNTKTGIFEKKGIPLEFTVMMGKGSQVGEKSAQIIQQFLTNVGIKMKLQMMEWSSFNKLLDEHKDPKDFDAVILGWSLGLDPDAYSIWHSSQYPKGFNFIGYQNETVDKLLVDGRLEVERGKRKVIYGKLYSEIAKDVPYYFLFYPDSLVAVNSRVKGLSSPGPAGLFNNIENVYIAKSTNP
ncbi:MAG: peptide-binding protein, partial [Candidatus Margulisbacteria bacterium]|nr:peptide-binding protein [Candidatus Margulisiibacteriota bacterium]